MPSSAWKDLASTKEDLDKAYKIRKQKVLKAVCLAEDHDSYQKLLNQGYNEVISSRTKKKVTLVKEKTHFDLFEDRVWTLFYNVGFTQMNATTDFGIPRYDEPERIPKQVDVFAFDGDIALVIDCKSAEKPGTSHSWRDELDTMSSYMDGVTKSIQEHFNNYDIQVAFCLVTENYIISDNSLRIARTKNISIINEYDLKYYSDLYKALGKFAKVQILSDVFGDTPIKSIKTSVPAIHTTLSGHSAYVFFIHPSQILPLSFVAHRKPNDPDVDKTYQRMIKKSKLVEIQKYIKSGGFFSNSIVVNINSDKCIFEPDEDGSSQKGILTLPPYYKSVWVIDGQHRLYSYSGLEEANSDLIPVTAFEQLSSDVQSKIFLDINSKQKKVDPNLLCAVESKSKIQSDDVKDWSLALNTIIFEEMSKNPKSPFYGRIKDDFDLNSKGDVTTRSLQNVMLNVKLIGYTNKAGRFVPGPLYYDKDEEKVKEETRKKAITFFNRCFKVFQEKCPDKWEKHRSEGGYLCTSDGLTALIMTFNEALNIAYNNPEEMYKKSGEELAQRIKRYLDSLADYFNSISQEEINRKFKNQLGSSGHDRCHKYMLEVINSKYPDVFINDKIRVWLEKSDLKYTTEVKEKLPFLEQTIVNSLKELLWLKYGEEWHKASNYEEIGIALNTKMYKEGNPKIDSIDDFIDIDSAYEIIKKSNWNDFRPYFAVKSDKGKDKANQQEWIAVLKDIKKSLELNVKIMQDEYDKFIKIYDELTFKMRKITEDEDEFEEIE